MAKAKKKSTPINFRIEMVTLTSCTMSNPNGDPDAGNAPRQLLDGTGLISHLSEKHKIREYWLNIMGENILYQVDNVRAPYFQAMDERKGDVRTNVCADTFDSRVFGTTITGLGRNVSVHGPVQFEMLRSVDVITPIQSTITCCAPATRKKATAKRKKKEGESSDATEKDSGRMGSQWVVPYGLYVGHVFISPTHAHRPRYKGTTSVSEFRGTGMTYEDYEKLVEALFYSYEHTRSAGRTGMVRKRVFAFEHSSLRGNGRATDLFNRIVVKLREGVVTPKSYDDYVVTVDSKKLPKGIAMWEYYLDDNGDVARKQLK